ncbi:MAG: hypothetical protein JXR96_03510 [Deltaproteobacteria bacterium]|nr:hypothetical protein [Deltaproteobacteria bacterium]
MAIRFSPSWRKTTFVSPAYYLYSSQCHTPPGGLGNVQSKRFSQFMHKPLRSAASRGASDFGFEMRAGGASTQDAPSQRYSSQWNTGFELRPGNVQVSRNAQFTHRPDTASAAFPPEDSTAALSPLFP